MYEKVNPCHPDKIADRIAGAIVDLAYQNDTNPKIAVEVLIGHGKCYVIAETSTKLDVNEVNAIIERIAGNVEIDYLEVPQDIHLAENQKGTVRCGDNLIEYLHNEDSNTFNVIKLLSVFKDEINIDEFNALCVDNNLTTSTAIIKIIGKLTRNNNIKSYYNYDTNVEQEIVAKWIASVLEMVPMSCEPKHLSVYHKTIIGKYHNTLTYLLLKKSTFNILINNDILNLKRIIEYYRQEAYWKEWIDIAKSAIEFTSDIIRIELIRSLLWTYFWSRNYKEYNSILKIYPLEANEPGVNDYETKYQYFNQKQLINLKNDLLQKLSIEDNYFNLSLYGRTCARLSLMTDNLSEIESLLTEAELYIKKALEFAKKFYRKAKGI